MNLTLVGTLRCDVSARATAGGIVPPLNAAETAQRAIPTRFGGFMARIFSGDSLPIRWGEGWGEGHCSMLERHFYEIFKVKIYDGRGGAAGLITAPKTKPTSKHAETS
jgi:hypothetical protein